MKKAVRLLQSKGFTIIEFLLFAAIFGILLGLATPYLFGAKEKVLLELERDRIVGDLKIAQQKAVSAYKGYDYSVEFDQANNRYISQPDGKTTRLPPQIEISSSSPSITFLRLTGTPSATLTVTLSSRKFKSEIQVSSNGLITSTIPERI